MDDPLAASDPEDPDKDLRALVAHAADLCLKPHRHAVRFSEEPLTTIGETQDCSLLIEARDAAGTRLPMADLELEIYRSGNALNLMLSRVLDQQSPLLWHGSHPVWMRGDTGLRCDRPRDGAPIEALARRLRALLDADNLACG